MHWDKGSPFCTWRFFKGHCTLNYENKKCMAGISLSDILCAINILITWFLTVSTLLAFGNVTLLIYYDNIAQNVTERDKIFPIKGYRHFYVNWDVWLDIQNMLPWFKTVLFSQKGYKGGSGVCCWKSTFWIMCYFYSFTLKFVPPPLTRKNSENIESNLVRSDRHWASYSIKS